MTQIGLMQLTVASLCYFTIGPRMGKKSYIQNWPLTGQIKSIGLISLTYYNNNNKNRYN